MNDKKRRTEKNQRNKIWQDAGERAFMKSLQIILNIRWKLMSFLRKEQKNSENSDHTYVQRSCALGKIMAQYFYKRSRSRFRLKWC